MTDAYEQRSYAQWLKCRDCVKFDVGASRSDALAHAQQGHRAQLFETTVTEFKVPTTGRHLKDVRGRADAQ